MAKGVSICITAYKAAGTIKATLDSIIAQTWFKDPSHKWEIRIGIDACKETEAYLNSILTNYKNTTAYMMDSNRGTYVTSNSIMSTAKYDTLIRFDADDIMEPNMVEELMRANNGKSIVRYKSFLRKVNEHNKRRSKTFSKGTILIPKEIFNKFGGYMPWMCAADDELLVRLNHFVPVKQLDKFLFTYIQYPTSLTNNSATSMRSQLREEYHKHTDNVSALITEEKDAIIQMETNTYKQLNPERIIVTMTSWTKRIDNVVPVVDHLLTYQSVKPDLVVINLSKTEFEGVELPTALKLFVEHNDKVVINWIEGPNTRQWKKIIPTLLKYPNDCVICIDDDMKYPPNFIKSLMEAHVKYPLNPVTTNRGHKVKGLLQHCGCGSLDKLCYYKGLEDINIVELSKNSSSDTFFTFMAHESGNDIKPIPIDIRTTPFNAVEPLSRTENTASMVTQLKMYQWMVANGVIVSVDENGNAVKKAPSPSTITTKQIGTTNRFRDAKTRGRMPLVTFIN